MTAVALQVEWCKLRRSPVVATATLLLAVVIPALALGFFAAATSGGAGALAGKAAVLLTDEGWAGYLGAVDQVAAAAAFVGAGVVVAWVFGREHADHTFAALFGTTVGRGQVAVAKFVVTLAWAGAVSVALALVAALLGLAVDVGTPTDDVAVVLAGLARTLTVTASTTTLALPVALVASVGRGYLPAIGAVVVLLAVAQVSVLLGGGAWFPFAVPGLVAVAGAPGVPSVGAAQVLLVVVTVVAGAAATVVWWQRAEVA